MSITPGDQSRGLSLGKQIQDRLGVGEIAVDEFDADRIW